MAPLKAARNIIFLHFSLIAIFVPHQPGLGLFWKKHEMDNGKPKSITLTSDLFAWLSVARQALPAVPKL